MLRILGFFACVVIAAAAHAADARRITHADALTGLKQALIDGSAAAVEQLGLENGFLGNPKVKIPLPPALRRIEGTLRYTGLRKQADELVVAMNRAAEAAAPEAKTLLIDAVRKMSVEDAKSVLTGGDTAATEYFRRATESQLAKRFRPIVKRATDQVGVTEHYNILAGQAAQLGLIKHGDATIEGYVTQKTLDGLFLMIAEQEKSFRRNPVGATSDIVKRVFGAMR